MEEVKFVEKRNYLVRLFDSEWLKNCWLAFRPLVLMIYPILFTLIIVCKRGERLSNNDKFGLLSVVLAAVWVYLGQILIYRHYYEYYQGFWSKILNLFGKEKQEQEQKQKQEQKQEQRIRKVQSEISEIFQITDKIVLIIWTALVLYGVWSNKQNLKFILIEGVEDIFFFLFIPICIGGAYLTGLGFCQAFRMIYTIWRIAKEELLPFNATAGDNVGNFSIVANYSFATVLYLSSGILFIPILKRIADQATSDHGILFFLIILFSIALGAAFIYPLLVGYRMAKKQKESQVQALRQKREEEIERLQKYQEMKIRIIEKAEKTEKTEKTVSVDEVEKILQVIEKKIGVWEKKIEILEKVSVYPFQLVILLKIFTLIIAPILPYILEEVTIKIMDLIK